MTVERMELMAFMQRDVRRRSVQSFGVREGTLVMSPITRRQDPLRTSVQSYTVIPFLKRYLGLFSKISIATYTTPHPEASPAASTAAASNNIQSQEPSNRDPPAGSDPSDLTEFQEKQF